MLACPWVPPHPPCWSPHPLLFSPGLCSLGYKQRGGEGGAGESWGQKSNRIKKTLANWASGVGAGEECVRCLLHPDEVRAREVLGLGS